MTNGLQPIVVLSLPGQGFCTIHCAKAAQEKRPLSGTEIMARLTESIDRQEMAEEAKR